MYATRTRTNRAVTYTHWNGISWSNGVPTAIKDAYIDADYSTTNGNFSCRDLIVTGTAILTIVAESYVKVLRDIIQDATSKIHIKNDGSLMILNKDATTDTAKVRIEKTFPNMQRLDYEFISSPISGIPIKNISPGTLDNRFYTYDEATNSYVSLNPYTTLTSAGRGYHTRMPADFPTTPSNYNIFFQNDSEIINKGNLTVNIQKQNSGFNLLGCPYLSKINSWLFFIRNKSIIEEKIFIWKKTNAAQGLSYNNINIFTGNLFNTKKSIPISQGFITIKKSPSPPNNIIFTPEMMLISNDFTLPDRLYINIKQVNVFHPIGGFCYDIKKFPLPFNDITGTGAISIIDGDVNKLICRKESFNIDDVINIRVFFEVTANYTITIREVSALFEDLENIYLVDNLLQTQHDLKLSDYTFSSNAGEFNTRFHIKFL